MQEANIGFMLKEHHDISVLVLERLDANLPRWL
jgi:hypothetical protein